MSAHVRSAARAGRDRISFVVGLEAAAGAYAEAAESLRAAPAPAALPPRAGAAALLARLPALRLAVIFGAAPVAAAGTLELCHVERETPGEDDSSFADGSANGANTHVFAATYWRADGCPLLCEAAVPHEYDVQGHSGGVEGAYRGTAAVTLTAAPASAASATDLRAILATTLYAAASAQLTSHAARRELTSHAARRERARSGAYRGASGPFAAAVRAMRRTLGDDGVDDSDDEGEGEGESEGEGEGEGQPRYLSAAAKAWQQRELEPLVADAVRHMTAL